MKEKILNFVKWLINYKETEIVPDGIVILQKTMDFVKIQSVQIISNYEQERISPDNIKHRLLQELIKELERSDLIEFQKIEDHLNRENEFRAILNIGFIK